MGNKKKKILFVTGTRAEYGLFRLTALKLKKSHKLDFKILATGMHTLKKYGSTIEDIKKDMPLDYVVKINEKDDMLSSLSKEIIGIKKYVAREKVHYLLVVGDRDEPFAAAIVGIHVGIPVIHVSGGDLSGPVVDTYLRNAITIFSRLHLVQTKRSKEIVIKMGADPSHVHVVGSAGLEDINDSDIPNKKALSVQLKLDEKRRLFLIVFHPTPLDKADPRHQIKTLLGALEKLDKLDEKVIICPNADTGSKHFLEHIDSLRARDGYHVFANLERKIFLGLLKHCDALIGNSSAGIMEAGYLKVPFVHVGNRQKGREHGANVIFSEYDIDEILKSIKKAMSKHFRGRISREECPYFDGDVSSKIVKSIQQFIGGDK